LDGQRLASEHSPKDALMYRSSQLFPAAKQMSKRMYTEKARRKRAVRRIIRDTSVGSALGVLMPIPVLDAGTVMLVMLRMVNSIAATYVEMAPTRDIQVVQSRVQMLMAPGMLAMLPLQRIKLLPTAGPFLNMSANALVTFGMGVATVEVFEKIVEHQMLFDEGAEHLLRRELDLLRGQTRALFGSMSELASKTGRRLLQTGKDFQQRVGNSVPSFDSLIKPMSPVGKRAPES